MARFILCWTMGWVCE